MVLVLADHRWAGGDVRAGSGAQEENIFRRTDISLALRQDRFYPILDDEAVVCQDVTVFKASEAHRCAMLSRPFRLDFVACPALHNPRLTAEGKLTPEDEERLRTKIRLVLRAAAANGNDALVLGAMGCGAWRNPPDEVARIMHTEIDRFLQRATAPPLRIEIACLEVDPSAYIVRHRDRVSNLRAFTREFHT